MIKAVCDICRKEVKQQPGVNFCDRCRPHAEKYILEYSQVLAESQAETQRKLESFGNRFLRENVLVDRPKLEVVNK